MGGGARQTLSHEFEGYERCQCEEGRQTTRRADETQAGVRIKHAHFPMLTTNVPGTGGTSIHSPAKF